MKPKAFLKSAAVALFILPFSAMAQVNNLFAVPALSELGLAAMVIAVASLAGWMIGRHKK